MSPGPGCGGPQQPDEAVSRVPGLDTGGKLYGAEIPPYLEQRQAGSPG